ncbi:MAG TPA: S8 family serine peptidase, partial [Gemmataceae bacterium]|nr:S8 family serine peptidase [Gemmataceae bacterium]
MRSRGRSPISRARLFVEYLEDRCTPAGLLDSLAGLVLADTPPPADKVNVVTADGRENVGTLAQLSAAPFAAGVQHVGFGIYNVTLERGTDVDAAVSYYSTRPGVTAAEPDYVIRANVTPNDTQFSSLWGMTKIGAPTAWDASVGSGNFVVAVIDSGVDYNHPDLAANMWHNPAETNGDGIDNDHNGLIDDYYGANFIGTNTGNPMDDNNHGTHVSGTIGAIGNNARGVAGVNWNVKIMALKFLNAQGSGSISDAVEALNYAVAHGVKVSNNSWGGGGYSSAMFAAIQNAQNAGHIFVAAAGNSSVNIDTTPSYPASYNLANVVAVASTTSSDQLSSFSNYGTNTTDIAAPGSGIVSTTPNNTYSNFSGTSMASPHVAGAIALYWDANPTATAAEVISRLTSTADTVAALNGYVAGGKRLNVGAMMQGVSPPPPPADTAGPQVTAAAWTGTTALSSVRVTFSEAINASSFTSADVRFTVPDGTITPTAVTAVNATQFDVTFTTQSAGGTYTMVIGPNITDPTGNPMNQDGDSFNGEPTEDQYTATRSLTTSGTTTIDWTGSLPIRDFTYTRATIAVNQDITLSDVNARFTASHTNDSDLVIRLIGPGGRVSTLVDRRGGSGNNFNNTTLDDEAG